MKKLVALLLAVVLVLGLMTGALAADGELAGKTVILHTNDVHGAIGLYAKVAALKKDYAEKGADVILVDAGDYIQGTPYVSDSQGKTAIELMNAAGYDVATFGNHEFDYGFANLQTIFKDAKFKVIGNIQYNGKLAFDGTTTASSRTSSSSLTLVNWPGSRIWSGLGISARTEKVPVSGSTCGSAKSTSPRSG